MRIHCYARPLFTLFLSVLALATFAASAQNEFFAMDTVAKGEPVAVARMLRDLGYDGLGGGLDNAAPAAIEEAGLKFFNAYYVIALAEHEDPVNATLRRWFESRNRAGTVLWLAIEAVKAAGPTAPARASPQSRSVAITALRALAAEARAHRVRISLYPHTGYWLEHFEDATELVKQLGEPNVALTFNLCHWLKVEGSRRDPLPPIRAALPLLDFITINGADAGDTQSLSWDRLIQPLDAGSYDVASFVRAVRSAGYTGPFGFQGYGIKGEARDVLARTIVAWQRMTEKPVLGATTAH